MGFPKIRYDEIYPESSDSSSYSRLQYTVIYSCIFWIRVFFPFSIFRHQWKLPLPKSRRWPSHTPSIPSIPVTSTMHRWQRMMQRSGPRPVGVSWKGWKPQYSWHLLCRKCSLTMGSVFFCFSLNRNNIFRRTPRTMFNWTHTYIYVYIYICIYICTYYTYIQYIHIYIHV